MRCHEIMHRRVCTVRETDNVALLCRTMHDENVGFVPVVDGDDVVVGIVTDRDVVVRACVGTGDPREVLVGSIMSRGVVSCAPTDAVDDVERMMREHRISRVVVLEDSGALAGVLSLSDIAQYEPPVRVGRTLQAIVERKYAF